MAAVRSPKWTLDEPEPGLLRYTLTDGGINYRISSARDPVDRGGRKSASTNSAPTEPIIQRQGVDRILVQVPGLQDPQRLKEILGQTAKLTFQMVDQTMTAQEALNGRPPVGSSILYSQDDPPIPYLIEDRVIVSGESLVDAQATFDQRTSEAVVSFRFDSKGASRFAQATQQNVGRPFAIILDNQVISAPQIREPILGGSGQISGNFTAESANDLAVLLRAGALPATLTVIEERTVGPGLGQDSIQAGKIAAIIGSILVVGFMFVAYGFLGFIANIALAVHVAMIIAILSVLGATLTLPGIAGIVLTIGMAVDSNVLIYERIREERRNGRSVIQAIDAGFTRALATIVDSNVTSLIATVVLFYLGTGPVKGFAVTFAIGILTTVFTAFTFTRWLVSWWLRRAKPKELPRQPVTFVPPGTRIPFMGHAALDLHAVGPALHRLCRGLHDHGHELRHRLQGRLAHRGPVEGRPSRSRRHPRPAVRAQHRRSAGAAVRRRHRRPDPRRHAGWRRERRAVRHREGPRRTGKPVRLPARRGGRTDRVGRTRQAGHDRHAGRAYRHPDLRLVPLRMAVRASARSSRPSTI